MPIRLSFVLVLTLILFVGAHAQVTVGIKAGPDFSKLLDAEEGYTASGGTEKLNTQSRTFVYGGIFVNIPVVKAADLYLRPQILYTGIGGHLAQIVDYNGNQLAPDLTYSLNYLDVPVQLLYSPSLPFGKPWIGAGLYAATIITGKVKEGSASDDLSIGDSPNDDIKRMDYGYSLTAGLTFKCHFLIGVDFQHGLTSIVPSSGSGSTRPNTRTSVLGIHLGYEWPAKK